MNEWVHSQTGSLPPEFFPLSILALTPPNSSFCILSPSPCSPVGMVGKSCSRESTGPGRLLKPAPVASYGCFKSLSEQMKSMGENPRNFPSVRQIPSLTSSSMAFMPIVWKSWYLFSNEHIALFGLFHSSCQEVGKTLICSTSPHVVRRKIPTLQ